MLCRKLATIAAVVLGLLALAAGTASATTTAVRHHTSRHYTRGFLAYKYALRQHGKWYCWGGTGPSCFDCSGLVYEAYRREHLYIGRTTNDMLSSGQLIRVSARQAHRGDLAFYGTGHVELWASRHRTYGAHDTGSRIGYLRWNSYWHPTAYYRVRGARTR